MLFDLDLTSDDKTLAFAVIVPETETGIAEQLDNRRDELNLRSGFVALPAKDCFFIDANLLRNLLLEQP
jgi:hypothetical protein